MRLDAGGKTDKVPQISRLCWSASKCAQARL